MKFSTSDIIYAHQLEQMRRFRAGIWKGGSGIAANHSGSRTRLVLKDKPRIGGATWEPYGSKGGSYTNQPRYGADITSLMRRINALQSRTTYGALGIAADADHLFACYGGAAFSGAPDKVYKFALDGTFVLSFGEPGTGDGQFNNVKDVAINGLKVFVLDAENNRIQEFDKDGVYQGKFSIQASGASINAIYADATHVFVAYGAGANRLEKYTHSGTLSASSAAGSRINTGLQHDGTTLYVCSSNSGLWSYDLSFGSATSLASTGVDNFSHLTISGSHIYVANRTEGEIEKYDFSGTLVSSFADDSVGVDFTNGELYATQSCELGIFNTSDTETDSFPFNHYIDQSEWLAYPTQILGDAVSLGTPDDGVSIPALNGIDGSEVAANYITNMRAVIESLAPSFTNAGTGAAFNWTNLSANNLYFVTFGSSYDWERNAAAMIADNTTYDVDINEIHGCVSTLETSDARC